MGITTNLDDRPITSPQVSLIEVLLNERVIDGKYMAKINRKLPTMTLGEAKELIRWMKEQPHADNPTPRVVDPPRPPPKLDITEGIWELGGEFFAVRRRRKTNQYHYTDPPLYAVRVDASGASYYSPTYIWDLRGGDPRKLTIDEAIEKSVASKHCAICGKKLRVGASIRAGIGPVCLSRQQQVQYAPVY